MTFFPFFLGGGVECPPLFFPSFTKKVEKTACFFKLVKRVLPSSGVKKRRPAKVSHQEGREEIAFSFLQKGKDTIS